MDEPRAQRRRDCRYGGGHDDRAGAIAGAGEEGEEGDQEEQPAAEGDQAAEPPAHGIERGRVLVADRGRRADSRPPCAAVPQGKADKDGERPEADAPDHEIHPEPPGRRPPRIVPTI
jgi:hypothetical protein